MNFRRRIRSDKRGFSIVEMAVVLAIVAIMTAVILWNLPDMKGGLSIDIVAQEVAIYLRGAQVYSRATKSSAGIIDPDSSQPAQPFHSFGLHFEKGNSTFFLWADKLNKVKSGDYAYYDGDAPAEESYELPKGFLISRIITEELADDINGSRSVVYRFDNTGLDTVFKRPDPEAYFACAPAEPGCPTAFAAWLELVSANGVQKRYIRVSNNGQIVVIKEAPEAFNAAPTP